ncbi:hypothetical protein [Rhodoferax sp.]|uniref:hypothetical protein n=1 Tax=Rhodoferax sp. TaxID=50421 RepID=UPI00374CAB44
MSKLPGVDFDFGGGRVYTIPPLSIGALQLLQSKLADIESASVLEPRSVVTIVQAAHAALHRNYPDITVAEVGELVDLGNMYDVMECVLDVAGMRRKSEADAKN